LQAMANDKPLPGWVAFSSSGLGGIFGWVFIHPVNTCGIRMNLAAVQNPGVKVSFASFVSRLSCATVAGGMAAYIACPCEVSLVRMSNDATLPLEQRRNYTGVINCATRIAQEEGIMAFWRGSTPFVTRACLVGATQVGTYDQAKKMYKDIGVSGGANVVCSSFTAGLVYSVITMPFESAKNRMASQTPDPATGKLPYTGTVQTLQKVAGTEGALSLYSGFTPYFLRCGGHTVLMFFAVEELQKMYRKMA